MSVRPRLRADGLRDVLTPPPTSTRGISTNRVIVKPRLPQAERFRERSRRRPGRDLASWTRPTGYTIAIDGKGYIKDRSEPGYKAAEQVSRKAHRLILDRHPPLREGREPVGSAPSARHDACGDKCPRHLEVPDRLYRKVPREDEGMDANDCFCPRTRTPSDYD